LFPLSESAKRFKRFRSAKVKVTHCRYLLCSNTTLILHYIEVG